MRLGVCRATEGGVSQYVYVKSAEEVIGWEDREAE